MSKKKSIAALVLLVFVLASTVMVFLRNRGKGPTQKTFVIHFEDMARLEPGVSPRAGVIIDKKSGTIRVEPGVDKVTISYGGGYLKRPCIACWVTFEISKPFARDASSQSARISKDGDVLESTVSYMMVCD